jgi:hypothetical protein
LAEHLRTYLERLPNGLGSYPDCRSKGILIRSTAEAVPFHESWNELPAAIANAFRSPPLPTAWVSTVLTNAVHCVIADTYYPVPAALLSWNYERTKRLSATPMYRMFAQLAGLKNFLRGAVKVHSFFIQGTDLGITFSAGGATITLEHPPYLHGGVVHLANEAVFRATLESAGATRVLVKMTESSPERAVFEASWAEA